MHGANDCLDMCTPPMQACWLLPYHPSTHPRACGLMQHLLASIGLKALHFFTKALCGHPAYDPIPSISPSHTYQDQGRAPHS